MLGNLGAGNEGDRFHFAGEEEIVHHLRALGIDVGIDLVNERHVLLREVDADIVRRGRDPDRLTLKVVRAAPDSQVMTCGKGVIALLIDEIGRAIVQQEERDGRRVVPALFDESLRRLEL